MARPHKTNKKFMPSGTRFGRWTVIEEDTKMGFSGQSYYLCKCDCGRVKSVKGASLRNGSSRSCGCLMVDSKKKLDRVIDHPLYSTWIGMKQRCENERNSSFKNYGGRGIRVCEDWLHHFSAFESWATENGYRRGLTLDRIDNNGDYSPNNCRWVSYKEQSRNRRSNHLIEINGVTKPLCEWSAESGISYVTILARERKGWSSENLLNPVEVKFANKNAKRFTAV